MQLDPNNSSPRARRAHSRGVAIMVVMGFIIVLTVLATAFAVNMKVEAKLKGNANSDVEVEWLCRSGVELAKYALSRQMADPNTPYDALNQIWAGGPGETNAVDTGTIPLNFTNNGWSDGSVLRLIYPDGPPDEAKESDYRCQVQIVDLESKYNINRAAEDPAREPVADLLMLMGVDPTQHDYIIDSIKDWRDTDDAQRNSGAETDYYQSLGYSAKDGPIDDLKELLLIRHVTPAIFWGSSTNQLAADPLSAPAQVRHQDPTLMPEEDEEFYEFGFVDVFTALSTGYINVNTAPERVIQMLPGVNQNSAYEIVRQRRGDDGLDGTYDDQPFRTIEELRNVAGFTSADAILNAQRFLSVRSATFEVTVTAEVRGRERTLVAVLSRKDAKDVKILFNYWK